MTFPVIRLNVSLVSLEEVNHRKIPVETNFVIATKDARLHGEKISSFCEFSLNKN